MNPLFCGVTNVGKCRDKNEDNFLILEDRGICVVADGMGGHQAGEVASQIAVDTLRDLSESLLNRNGVFTKEHAEEDARFLSTAINKANAKIHLEGMQDKSQKDMGTTIVAGIFRSRWAALAYVGDSRIYRFRQGCLEQVTIDHSWVGELVRRDLLSREQARVHPLRNVITRALGMGEVVQVDTIVCEVEPGDIYVFCTDGLTDLVPDSLIESTIKGTDHDPESAAQNLIDIANDRGGTDNITVGIVAFSG
ncbi:MAG: Stp1/IreP family PP2C-type Ser/Thr phosphatase [Planctomycetes bacterium]|nr:Stp1/IreP family PP2C-type Ser/Thr phosphatase [Planctomycetota bacterium]